MIFYDQFWWNASEFRDHLQNIEKIVKTCRIVGNFQGNNQNILKISIPKIHENTIHYSIYCFTRLLTVKPAAQHLRRVLRWVPHFVFRTRRFFVGGGRCAGQRSASQVVLPLLHLRGCRVCSAPVHLSLVPGKADYGKAVLSCGTLISW